jgi:hypothetical protein
MLSAVRIDHRDETHFEKTETKDYIEPRHDLCTVLAGVFTFPPCVFTDQTLCPTS